MGDSVSRSLPRRPPTMSLEEQPQCQICSFRQPAPDPKTAVYHKHDSARQHRILQNVEYELENKQYLCPTCQSTHLARPEYGLNICVSASELHGFHFPSDETIVCPPDTVHVDWLTIPGATLPELEFAWTVDYHRQKLPMRILVVAGLEDLIKGGTKDSIMESLRMFKKTVDHQNHHHPGASNQFAVAPLLFPPKVVWYPDNGKIPANHGGNRESEILALNEAIFNFNAQNGFPYAPHFYTLGVRRYRKWFNDGSWRMVTHHRMGQWSRSEPRHEKLYLGDHMKIKMGQMVLRYFEGEAKRESGPIAWY